jgi:hypothetical protein
MINTWHWNRGCEICDATWSYVEFHHEADLSKRVDYIDSCAEELDKTSSDDNAAREMEGEERTDRSGRKLSQVSSGCDSVSLNSEDVDSGRNFLSSYVWEESSDVDEDGAHNDCMKTRFFEFEAVGTHSDTAQLEA